MSSALRIGTRASALALWQANRVADLIRAQPGAPAVELVHIKTEGDMRTDVPLFDTVDQLRWEGPAPSFAALATRMGSDAGLSKATARKVN